MLKLAKDRVAASEVAEELSGRDLGARVAVFALVAFKAHVDKRLAVVRRVERRRQGEEADDGAWSKESPSVRQ